MEQNTHSNTLAQKLGLALSVFIFLLPVFFMPVLGVSLYAAKITLVASALVIIFAIFLSSVLLTGTIEIPKAKYLLPILAFAVISLVSSVFSGAIGLSFMGSIFDLGTSGSILMLVFALFLTIMAVRSIGAMGRAVSAFTYGAVALAVYTLLGTIASYFLPSSFMSKIPFFPAGSAVDTAIIFGAAVILALCIINMSEVSKRMRYILYALIAFSLVFIGAVNFMPVVIILALVSLMFLVYILSWSVGRQNPSEDAYQGEGTIQQIQEKISLSSLAVLIVSVVFILGGSGISGLFSKIIKIQTLEVRPNFQITMELTKSSWKQNFALGVGPNRFSSIWNLHKPVDTNRTQLWNNNFYSGSGFIPTVAVTTGLLGLLALLAFITMYLQSGVKAIFAQANASRSRYLATASFLVSLYLWVMLFFYTPSIAVLILAFIFTGLFTATLSPQGITQSIKINIFSNPKINFLSVLSIVVLLIMSVAGGYFVWEKSMAAVIFERGILRYQNTGDIASARESTIKAINMAPSDIYWRGLAEISMTDLGRVLEVVNRGGGVTESIRVEAQTLIADSIESAKKATELNGDSFQNWFALGRVYEVLASNGVQGSAESARSSYNEATMRSPGNPSVPLALARLDALAGNLAGARENIAKALELKNNYTDAYYTLAQLEVAANNIPGAIKSVEAATVIDSSNSGLYFQLGLLKYNWKDWGGAVSALERAVTLVSDYANAKYFLGLSYEKLGRDAEAIVQFEDIQKTNPDNGEIALILKNLRAGKSPFVGAEPPVTSSPEKRVEPPVGE